MKLVGIYRSIKDSLLGQGLAAPTETPPSGGNVVAMDKHFALIVLEGLARSRPGRTNAVDTRRLTSAHLVWLASLDGRSASRLQALAGTDAGRALAEVMAGCERQRALIVKLRGASTRRTAPLHRTDPDLDRPVPDHVVGLEEARSMRLR